MNSLVAIALSSVVAGTLDLFSAVVLAKKRGMSFASLLQFVASGALGEAAFQGGLSTVMAGMFFHYLIALIWAGAYFLLGRTLPDTLMHPFVCGTLFGIVVHLVMSFVVIPLSRTPKKPFAWQPWLIQLAIHITLVGLPIALIQSWWLRG